MCPLFGNGRRVPAARPLTGLSVALLAWFTLTPAWSRDDLPRGTPETVGVSAGRLRRIDEVIQRHIDEHRIAGAVTLVARQGKVVHFAAHGQADVEAKKPMATDTPFRMASSTKPVTGVAVMMLVEEGKVRLADPVAKFIPEFKDLKVAVEKDGKVELVAAERPVTIRDLLTHTSGLVSGGVGTRQAPPEATRPGGDDTLETYTARAAKVPLDFQPGSRWSYSGLAGIDALARVVEVASGQPFDEFLKQRVFTPLGMTDTSFLHGPEDPTGRLAAIHRPAGNRVEKIAAFLRFPKGYHSGAGGLISTAADYFRFGQMLANGGEWGGQRLLSPRAVELLSSNHVGEMFGGQLGRPKGMGFGLTVEVVTDPVRAGTFRSAGSYGWDGAFGTHFWVDPREKLVAVLLVQAPAGPVTRGIQADFETAVMQALTAAPQDRPGGRPNVAPGPPAAERHDFARWEREIAAYEAADRANPPPKGAIVFTGASTIKLWTTLAADFPDHKVINRGFGGSEVRDATHFADRIVFPYEPRQIFLRAGSNDIHLGRTPEQVAADFAEFVHKVCGRLPRAEVLFVSTNPIPSRWSETDKYRDLNERIRKLATGLPRVGFVDVFDVSLDRDGQVRNDLFLADRLHFNAAGNKLFADRIRPYLIPTR
jgi:CubicO group peptidase (beta-lactamase class C family)/lysophospholipase L1-like esterase